MPEAHDDNIPSLPRIWSIIVAKDFLKCAVGAPVNDLSTYALTLGIENASNPV